MSVTDYLAVIGGMKGPLVAMGVTTSQELDAIVSQARIELEQGQSYWRFPLAYGQRPQ